jgi:hypothetical protein
MNKDTQDLTIDSLGIRTVVEYCIKHNLILRSETRDNELDGIITICNREIIGEDDLILFLVMFTLGVDNPTYH